MADDQPRISEVTRRGVFDRIVVEGAPWCGRFEEAEFLARLYDLREMHSTGGRFRNAYGDIVQHRQCNDDWPPDWVFTDGRFNLLHCPDDEFLRFLCEIVHPVVQPDQGHVTKFLDIFNSCLAVDGFQIVETTRISGRAVFAGHEMVAALPAITAIKAIGEALTAEYLNQQITRMAAAIHNDPALAIGTAKELIETCCKTILRECGRTVDESWELPKLVHETLEEFHLAPGSLPGGQEVANSLRRTLGNLAHVANGAAELRNLYGTGHGKDAEAPLPEPHHARLAVGAASTLTVFLFEEHQVRRE